MSFEDLRGVAGFEEFIQAIVALQDEEKEIAHGLEDDMIKVYRAQGANAFAEKVLELVGE